jgi:hypothetical protein
MIKILEECYLVLDFSFNLNSMKTKSFRYFLSIFTAVVLFISFSCEQGGEIEPVKNSPPVIMSLTANKVAIHSGESVEIVCVAYDPDGEDITYEWHGEGSADINGNTMIWYAPEVEAEKTFLLYVIVRDGREGSVTANIQISVSPEEPEEPESSYYIKYVCDDAYVREEYPDEKYGTEPILCTGPGYYIYLRFNIEDIFNYIDRGKLSSIEEVEIRLAKGYNNTAQKPIGTTELYGISGDETLWVEELVTYNTKPKNGNKIAEVKDITYDIDGVVVFDVKTDFLNCVQLHNYYSVMVSTPSLSVFSSSYFYSKELKVLYPEYGDAATPVLWIKYKSTKYSNTLDDRILKSK